ncbi:MAG: hypothetical protein JNN17_11585 [Verrucomicrobiaceae bacterium]|nr:hypothetical protein [Verrucomicrobiaceae bacterium]
MPAVLHPSRLAFIAVMSVGVAFGQGTTKKPSSTKSSAPKPVIVAAVTTKVAAAGVSTSSAAKTTIAPPRPAPKTAAPTLPRIQIPQTTMPQMGYARYPWKLDIVATVFWVGEQPTENNPTPNHMSSWDTEWMKNFGGYDDPDRANRTDNFTPIGFTPRQNPFYIALPYNDVVDYNTTKSSAKTRIPWFKQKFSREGKSVLKGTWLAIRYGNRICYAQWEDCGPFETDDVDYVFGTARPRNTSNNGAGIDVSPAVRDYLGMPSMSRCDWRFVDVSEVPAGPWRNWGTNNPFVQRQQADQAAQKTEIGNRLEELRKMRDEYFKQNGNSQMRNR